jgi:hypothetical protein
MVLAAWMVSAAFADNRGAAFNDGNDLLRGIRDVERSLDGEQLTEARRQNVMHALGFFEGALGHAALWSKIDKACPYKLPDDKPVSVEQLIRVTEKFLRENPKWLNEAPELIVFLALREAFPRQ